jgi:transcriptional regulator with XRE-family HTH domain
MHNAAHMKKQHLALLDERNRREMTQAEFAKFLGIDQGTLSRWEANGVPQRGPARMAVANLLAQLRGRKMSSRDG